MKVAGKLILGLAVAALVLSFSLAPSQPVSATEGECTTTIWEGTWDGVGLQCTGATHVDCTGAEISCPPTRGPIQQT